MPAALAVGRALAAVHAWHGQALQDLDPDDALESIQEAFRCSDMPKGATLTVDEYLQPVEIMDEDGDFHLVDPVSLAIPLGGKKTNCVILSFLPATLTLVFIDVRLPSCKSTKSMMQHHFLAEDLFYKRLSVSEVWHGLKMVPWTEHQAQGSRTHSAVARDLLLLQRGLECGFAEGPYGLAISGMDAPFAGMGLKRVVRALKMESPLLLV